MSEAIVKLKNKQETFPLTEKTSSTGSTGFHAQGKLTISDAERYQINILVVLIGSKPKKEAEEKETK